MAALLDLTLRCPTCGKRADVCFAHGDDWKKRPTGVAAPRVPVVGSSNHDPAARRRSKRGGRERGCWLYVPAEYVASAGIDVYAPPPEYRVWAGRKGTLLVQLYPRADDGQKS